MPAEVLHTTDHRRHGARAFLRLELTADAVIVVVHELGPRRVREDTDESREQWHRWQAGLEPPTLADDVGTTYTLSPLPRQAIGSGQMPSDRALPMKATISWRFTPAPRPEARRFTIDGRWTVERPRSSS